jgi:hypothetical protein
MNRAIRLGLAAVLTGVLLLTLAGFVSYNTMNYTVSNAAAVTWVLGLATVVGGVIATIYGLIRYH